jgi:DNA polymerase-3 subunit epsilon
MSTTEFAIIDFETTGLKAGIDRVIEVGVVRTDAEGNVLAEMTSVVNPMRDVGPTSIHGIYAAVAAAAPTFAEIIGHLTQILNGAVLVAHNAKFDARFLRMELARSNVEFSGIDPLCTLELMYLGFPRGPRRLGDCCAEFDLPVGNAHSALDDAHMAAELLHFLIRKVPVPFLPSPVEIHGDLFARGQLLDRRDARRVQTQQGNYLRSLVERLDDQSSIGLISAASVAQYMNILDLVLEDRRVTTDEADELAALADDLSLGRDRVQALHASYVTNLCYLAKSDGVVTESEIRDLADVAELLGVGEWHQLLGDSVSTVSSVATKAAVLTPGTSVCFTGEMEISRTELSERSSALGLDVRERVTKDLDLLVLADTDSMSGKARKARDYGIRLVAERVFLQLIAEAEQTSNP